MDAVDLTVPAMTAELFLQMQAETAATAAAAAAPPAPKEVEGIEVDTFNTYEPSSFPQTVVEHLSNPDHPPVDDAAGLPNPLPQSSFPQSSFQSSLPSTWACASCTFSNPPANKNCEMCSMKKPPSLSLVTSSSDSTPTAPPPATEPAVAFSSSTFATPPSHSFPSCESTLMTSVLSPPIHTSTYQGLLPTTSLPLANTPSLTPLQLEGVTLALSSFRTNSKHRHGFFLGDSAGIGKGRQIAATIYSNFIRGQTRHIWLSVSRSLIDDARRDFADIGAHGITVHDGMELLDSLSKKGLGSGGEYDSGVIFLTYQLLISTNGARFDQLKAWLQGKDGPSYSGCIVFDECHKAKNIAADTKTSKYVLQIQRDLPSARVLYASATGVSEIEHMFYAERLGLWGAGTNYHDFEEFKKMITDRGIGGLEMLSLEMKMKGVFIARTLSWVGADFETVTVPLPRDDETMYNASAEWWSDLKTHLGTAQSMLNGNVPKNIIRMYWSASQRFFREMAVTFKVNYVIESALEDVKNGCNVVIGLQTTGEAATSSYLDDALADSAADSYSDIKLPKLISTAYGIAHGFVKRNFPVKPVIEIPDEPVRPVNGTDYDNMMFEGLTRRRTEAIEASKRGEVKELVTLRDNILADLEALTLPANAMDDMIDRFGGPSKVAEMTGRTGRILRQPDSDAGAYKFEYTLRGGMKKSQTKGLSSHQGEVELDVLNIAERQRFQDGKKNIAIISDAASTGISLHANVASGSSERRRVHYTIELPWAADKAIQQLGRTHRAGQLSAPHYKLVVTNLGGERRYAAAVSKRMASLGAITKGDRRAATGSDMSDFNVDSKHGTQALTRMLDTLVKNSNTRPSSKTNEVLDEFIQDYNYTCHGEALGVGGVMNEDDMEIMRENAFDVAKKALDKVGLEEGENRKKADVKMFLNRIAGLPVGSQNMIFKLFSTTLDDIIATAKKNGWYEGCVEDLFANEVTEELTQDIAESASGVKTTFSCFVLDRGWELDKLIKAELEDFEGDGEEVIGGGVRGGDDAMDDFIVNDEEEEEDEGEEDEVVLDSPFKRLGAKKDVHCAETGFYMSRKKIMGAYNVVFCKRKFASLYHASGASDMVNMDPLGVMVAVRPNTGRTGQEFGTVELLGRYQLVRKLQGTVSSWTGEGDKNEKEFVARWSEIYQASDSFEKLAKYPSRKRRVGIVHGSVMSVFPALTKAVANAVLKKDRALKVVRVDVGGKKVIGVEFPTDKLGDLEAALVDINNVRKVKETGGQAQKLFQEGMDAVNSKMLSKAVTKPKTILSFFSATSAKKGNEENGARNNMFAPSKFASRSGKAKKRSSDSKGAKQAKPGKQAKLGFGKM